MEKEIEVVLLGNAVLAFCSLHIAEKCKTVMKGTDAVEESNDLVSVDTETTAAVPLPVDNDLVIGRASEKMILAEISAEDLSENSTNSPVSSSSEDSLGRLESTHESSATEMSTETTPRLPQFEFMPQFEHSTYDFMVPEGTSPNSTILAVISYLGRKDRPMPLFKISFDRMRWFEIGSVTTRELENYAEYMVTINQRADVYVQHSLTKNGSYKFSIEAHDDGKINTASIRVDVLSLSPTTRRTTKITTSTTQETIPVVNITTTREVLSITTPLITTTKNPADGTKTGKSADAEVTASSSVENETTVAENIEVEVTETTGRVTKTTSGKEEESATSEAIELPTSGSEENEESQKKTTTEISQPIPTAIITIITTETSPPESSNPGPTTLGELDVQTTTAAADNLEEVTSETTAEVLDGSTEDALFSMASDIFTDSHPSSTTAPTSTEENAMSENGQETTNPAKETITMTTTTLEEETTEISATSNEVITSTEEKRDEIKIVVEGAEEDKFHIEGSLESGSLLRGLAVSVISGEKKKGYTKLLLADDSIFDIKPKHLYSGNKAYLFVKNPSLLSTSNAVKIMAEGKSSTAAKEITITAIPPARTESKNDVNVESEMINVIEYKVSIPEDAPSGFTVYQIKDGDRRKLVGPPGVFSLIGKDLILTCPDEGSCLDYEKQQVYHVLLVDTQGQITAPVQITINVQDVNDNQPHLEVSDNHIRLSNNRLISPFFVQILDGDSPAASENRLSLAGSAAGFLGLSKISENLYQVDVIGFAPSGKHELEITVSDDVFSDKVTVNVQAQNSRSHARFRRPKYTKTVTADKIHEGNQLLQVELEGVPIDEARFVILQGNPGWLSIDDYGGRIGIAKFIKEVEAGDYTVSVGAVDRQSNALLAQTTMEIKVVGGAEMDKMVFDQTFYERSYDREMSSDFTVPFKLLKRAPVTVDTALAIDENGQQIEFNKRDVTVKDQAVVFKQSALSNLRAVSVQLSSNGEKATVMLSLTSSPEFIEKKKRESTRPIFPKPWTRTNNVIEVTVPEELPKGYIVYSLPAVNPSDGSLVAVRMDGNMAEAFNFDSNTGAVSIAHRLDFESITPYERSFSLMLTAGSPDYESVAELRITVINIDDNPPVLEKEGLNNELPLPENLPPSTVIASLGISDADFPSKNGRFVVEKSGLGSELYTASVVNSSLLVSVAENATLDRETMERQTLHLIVKDEAGNQDSATLSIRLLDVNDNAPRFSQDQYAMQVVDNWPPGVVVDRVMATDSDTGKNARIIYSLSTESAKYFAVDATTGEVSVARELAGAAREQPYELVVVAEDAGTPSLSSSVRIKVKVSEPFMEKDGEKGQVNFINPPVDYVLKLKEDTPENEHIYQVKARLAGMSEERMNIKYSLKNPRSEAQHFGIDESSGEVYVTKPLDYEEVKYYSQAECENCRKLPDTTTHSLGPFSLTGVDELRLNAHDEYAIILTLSGHSSQHENLVFAKAVWFYIRVRVLPLLLFASTVPRQLRELGPAAAYAKAPPHLSSQLNG
ncbi:unnamed protein product [Cylicocyclus nassatus]|uniref:Cadherin domain-containing protein n=1 Tax=Cylicocyclus nassatus TaxID=53992 RepID=A0AA36H1S6_CYLNA|nr:unnamed protein product [Cylicocyclus nassatus]